MEEKTMKTMKKLTALFLTLCILAGLSITAGATYVDQEFMWDFESNNIGDASAAWTDLPGTGFKINPANIGDKLAATVVADAAS